MAGRALLGANDAEYGGFDVLPLELLRSSKAVIEVDSMFEDINGRSLYGDVTGWS